MKASSFLRSGLIVAVGILIGRISGLLRDILLAKSFGASALADGITIILTLPDLLTGLFVGGAISAVLVPEYQSLDERAASRLYWRSSLQLAIVFCVIAFVLYLGLDHLIKLLAPGLSSDLYNQGRGAIGLSLLGFPLAVLAAISTSYLQSKRFFAVSAFGTLIVNLTLIIAILLVGSRATEAMYGLAIAIIIGGVLRWLSQVFAIKETPSFGGDAPAVANSIPFRRYVEALGAGSILLFLPVVARSVASLNEAGSISLMNYSLKLVEFPLSVVLTVFSTVLFPYFSKALLNPEEKAEATQLSVRVVQWVLVLSGSAMVLLFGLGLVLRKGSVSFGELTARELQIVGQILILLVLSLVARALSSIHVMLFNSHRDTKTPLYINIAGLLLLLLMVVPLQKSLGVSGVGLALTITFWCIFVTELVLLRSKHQFSLVPALNSSTSRRLFCVILLGVLITWAYSKWIENFLFGAAGASVASGLVFLVGFYFMPDGRLILQKRLRTSR